MEFGFYLTRQSWIADFALGYTVQAKAKTATALQSLHSERVHI